MTRTIKGRLSSSFHGKKMLNFALVGCGRIAQKHAKLLGEGKVSGAQLSAVCDIKADAAKEIGERYGVPYFTDFHVMMKTLADKIDVVNVLTESGYHAGHCIALAPYGKQIVVEKPMALTLADADDMIKACDRAGIKLFVVKQNRYNLPVRKLMEALRADRFGKIVMGSVRVRWCRRQEYYDQAPWRGTWAMDGGVFSNQASHHVDLLEWCLGEPVSVVAKSRRALANIEAEDTGVAIITFRSGAIGIVEATTAARPKDTEGSLSILGEKGLVEIGGFAVNKMRTWNFADKAAGDDEVLEKYWEDPPDVYGFGHVAYLDDVVDAINNRTQSLVDGLEGRKSLELISAIYESIETGREVHLRFEQKCGRLGRK
jgi:UDP-N-acetyl-2-amino-2-deoxyglucuronate dehydrogenase